MVNVNFWRGYTCKDCEWQANLCKELTHEDNEMICDDFSKKPDDYTDNTKQINS